MHHLVHHIGRLGMGGGVAGLEAATLVDGHIDQHAARLHALEHLAADQLGCCGTGDQHRTDDEVRAADFVFQIGLVRKARLGAALEMDAKPF